MKCLLAQMRLSLLRWNNFLFKEDTLYYSCTWVTSKNVISLCSVLIYQPHSHGYDKEMLSEHHTLGCFALDAWQDIRKPKNSKDKVALSKPAQITLTWINLAMLWGVDEVLSECALLTWGWICQGPHCLRSETLHIFPQYSPSTRCLWEESTLFLRSP